MASSPYRRAVLLNNHGVHQLEHGNFHAARDIFLAAMEEIKLLGLDRKVITNDTPCVRWSNNALLLGELNIPDLAPSPFFFRRALAIVSDLTPSPGLVVESVAIIYNCALSLLVDGFVANTSKNLSISRRLFEIAIAIQEQDLISQHQRHPEQVLLHAVMCNNLGWIHGEQCNFELAAHCFHVVVSSLSAMNQSALQGLDPQDSHGFVMNLFWCVHPYGASAA